MDGVGAAEDQHSVVKLVGGHGFSDFQAAFDRAFSRQPLQDEHYRVTATGELRDRAQAVACYVREGLGKTTRTIARRFHSGEDGHMARRGGFRTQAPKQITLIIAIVLWVIGLLAGLGVLSLPNNLGFWALVVAGLLAILGALVNGL